MSNHDGRRTPPFKDTGRFGLNKDVEYMRLLELLMPYA